MATIVMSFGFGMLFGAVMGVMVAGLCAAAKRGLGNDL